MEQSAAVIYRLPDLRQHHDLMEKYTRSCMMKAAQDMAERHRRLRQLYPIESDGNINLSLIKWKKLLLFLEDEKLKISTQIGRSLR